jgi:translation initiation factor IF-2
LAQASKALLLGFNVSISNTLKKKAQALQVEVKSYSIIYELTDYLTQLTQGMIEIEYEDVSIGKLEVL